MSEKNLIPELRFPAFEKDGEWTVSSIDKLCDILNNIRKPVTSTNRTAGPYPYYGASGIIDFIDKFLFDERLLLIGEDGAKWGAYDNTAFLVEGKYWVNNHAHVLKPIGIDEKLLESYLVKLDLNPYITGAAPPKLTLRKLKEIPVPVPSTPEEQQKIASCLSSLDELIAAHKDKLDALKDHKKGLMQNLFPQDGEKVPKLRFKEFKDSGEWDVKTLGEVLIKNSKKNKNQKYSQVESVSNKFGFIKQDEYFKNRRVASKDTSNYYVIKKGYFAYNPSRIDVGSLAYKHNDEISIISPLYVSFKANNELINDYFLLSFFNSVTFTKQMIFEGGVRNTLNYDNLIQSKIPIPTIQEQQRIASCLSALDELITAQQEKIDELQQHKKGLMQGLFPKIND